MASGKKKLPSHIVGPGRLGSALTIHLHRAGWRVQSLMVRPEQRRLVRISRLAKAVGAKVLRVDQGIVPPGVVWITVPDDAIARVANELSSRQEWREGIVFHCSGALTSDELEPLRKQGAKAASVHPVMTFAANTVPSLQGVAFGIEGDAAAVRLAKQIVRDLGGVPVEIRKENKVLYHVLGAFASPMLIALMAALEDIGMAAGFEPRQLRAVAGPLLRQTLENYLERGAAAAFTGPFVRGDVAVIRRHLSHLEEVPLARDVYLSLARAAVENLPVKDRDAMRKVLGRKK